MTARIASDHETEFARVYLNKLRAKDLNYIRSHFSAEYFEGVTDDKLKEISSYFPKGEPSSTKLIGVHINKGDNKWQGNFTFEYEFRESWAVANVVMIKKSNDLSVIGFNVYRTPASQAQLNAFSLDNKSLTHYLILFGAIVVPLFIITSLVCCIRTPIRKRRWLWILFVAVGVASISINWTTGQVGIRPISVHLLGAGATAASPHSAWVITVAFPLGAILFWLKRRGFLRQSMANHSPQPTQESRG